MIRRNLLNLILLILSINLAGCNTRKPQASLYDVLTASECSPPCWMGMTPGETTPKEVLQQFTAYPELVDPYSIYICPANEWYPIQIAWSVIDSDINVHHDFTNDFSDSISIYTDENKMNLGDGIALYGTPEKVFL